MFVSPTFALEYRAAEVPVIVDEAFYCRREGNAIFDADCAAGFSSVTQSS
jgi:hypothetical protein